MSLYSIDGRLVYKKDVQMLQANNAIDLTNLKDGTYILNVNTAGKNFTQKIIKASK